MPRRLGRRRTLPPAPTSAPPPRTPVGSWEEIGAPATTPAPPAERGTAPPPTLAVAGEFRTAAAALVFAGGFTELGSAEFGHCARSGAWWVATSTTVAVGRELIIAAGGRMHVEVDGRLVPDRGWGDEPPTGSGPLDQPEIVEVDVTDLVRTAGLHRHVLPVGERITVLAPARRTSGIAQRALDLGLGIETRLVRLDPLFDSGPTASMFEVRLTATSGVLPVALLAALDRDPLVLVCRTVSERLIVQQDMASPLPDDQLAVLAARETDAGMWLLADVGFGCARLSPLSDLRDGTALVRLTDRHRLTDLDDGWAGIATSTDPEPVSLQVVPARTPDAVVEAVLLDDDDLQCLPALLAGRPLADLATLARGRDQHLMLAPGGVLERLPVGDPLYRWGPGPLFLRLGTRTQPHLPPTARQALFGASSDTALVVLPERIAAFPLTRTEPVWTLWAGPLPTLDLQLSRDARRSLAAVDEQTTVRPAPPRSVASRLGNRIRGQTASDQPRTWQQEALAAELADDLVHAAELCERHGQLRRAALLYERAARRPRPTARQP